MLPTANNAKQYIFTRVNKQNIPRLAVFRCGWKFQQFGGLSGDRVIVIEHNLKQQAARAPPLYKGGAGRGCLTSISQLSGDFTRHTPHHRPLALQTTHQNAQYDNYTPEKPEYPTLSSDDLSYVFWWWHWNALGHVLRFLRPVVRRRREAEWAGQRVGRRQIFPKAQHTQLQSELERALVLHQAGAAATEVAEQAWRHFHLRSYFGGFLERLPSRLTDVKSVRSFQTPRLIMNRRACNARRGGELSCRPAGARALPPAGESGEGRGGGRREGWLHRGRDASQLPPALPPPPLPTAALPEPHTWPPRTLR